MPIDQDVSFRQFVAQQANDNFSFRPVSVTSVYNLLVNLSTSKATGMDNIAAKVLQLAAPATAPSLRLRFFTCQLIPINSHLNEKLQKLSRCLRKVSGLCWITTGRFQFFL